MYANWGQMAPNAAKGLARGGAGLYRKFGGRSTGLNEADDFLNAPDANLVRRLQSGVDVEIPAGTTGIRTLMSDLTLATGNETALLRLSDGTRVLRMGGPTSVSLGRNVKRIVAHTHPSGRLKFSGFDVGAMSARGQHSSVIIDARANMGARLPVTGEWS